MFSLNIDTAILRALELLPAQIEAAQGKALDRAAELVMRAKAREIDRTTARPIPTREQIRSFKSTGKAPMRKQIGKGGNPAWKRSGDWAKDQQVSSPSPTVRVIETVGPSADYEARLADLPTGALGINRTNKASEEAHRKTEPQLTALVESEVRNALGL